MSLIGNVSRLFFHGVCVLFVYMRGTDAVFELISNKDIRYLDRPILQNLY